MSRLTIVLVGCCLTSHLAFADGRLIGQVTDSLAQPVRDASVYITGPSGLEETVTTDPTGHYSAVVHGSGDYNVVFAFGKNRVSARVAVPDKAVVKLDTTLEMDGEVIEVQELPRPLQLPKPKFDVIKIPPYSDEVALGDKWVKAWMLLEIDDHGIVQRLKFLHRPGNGLDDIAVKYSFGLTFTPGRDRQGKPQRWYLVFPIEWPSMGWMQRTKQAMNRMPTYLGEAAITQRAGRGFVMNSFPPCANGPQGSGLVLDEHYPAPRDCSQPDFELAKSEPWIVRGEDVPAPVVSATPALDPYRAVQDGVDEANRNRKKAIIATVVTGAVLVATVSAGLQYQKYSSRVSADNDPRTTLLPPGKLQSDTEHKNLWSAATIGLGSIALLTATTSVRFWHRASTVFTFAPNGEGASMMVSGTF